MGNKHMFKPDYAIPPGETLLETLEAIGMTQADLADRTGRPKKTINEIIKGKTAITPETALQLERVLGVPASFWNNLERNYREALAVEEEQLRLQKQVEWLKLFPIKVLQKLGYVKATQDKTQQLTEVLNFFGVSSPGTWEKVWLSPEVAFRKSETFESSPHSIATWLRLGELRAKNIGCSPYDKAKFKQVIQQIRNLTLAPVQVWHEQIVALCAEAGVAVVFIPEIPGTRVSGVTRWLSDKKALIQLSLRHKTDDHLWFTFFHEAAHILLHGKKEVFIEGLHGDLTEKEEEANKFSRDFLIPLNELTNFLRTNRSYSKQAIKLFAIRLGIPAGIVVGRLQHDRIIPMSNCNDLKTRYKFEWDN